MIFSKGLLIKFFLILMFIYQACLIPCIGGEMINNISNSKWEELSKKRVYFGHQSVGNNIWDGIKVLVKEYPFIKLNFVETPEYDTPGGFFAHFQVGENKIPQSKIDAFSNNMNKGLGKVADIAFFKLCYVDITSETKVEELFTNYKNKMQILKKTFPDKIFVHITIPLRIVQTGIKVWIKNKIGRAIGGYADNIKRNDYNDLLLKEYQGKEPIFDLAKVESTDPDGNRSAFEKDGKTYYSLSPIYTDDGGHLNDKGSKIAGEQLLVFLTKLN